MSRGRVYPPASHKKTHRPRSRTKKPVVSDTVTSEAKEIFTISDTSTEYVDTPEVPLETYYRHSARPIPRKSIRLQAHSTKTPIMTKAQKRKANGSSRQPGTSLLLAYPYSRFTIDQVNELFNVYQIKLGTSPQEKHMLISAIKNLGRQQFAQVLDSLAHIPKDIDGTVVLSLDHLVANDEQVANNGINHSLI